MTLIDRPCGLERVGVVGGVAPIIEEDVGRKSGGHLIEGIVALGVLDLMPVGVVSLREGDFLDRATSPYSYLC